MRPGSCLPCIEKGAANKMRGKHLWIACDNGDYGGEWCEEQFDAEGDETWGGFTELERRARRAGWLAGGAHLCPKHRQPRLT